jgi:hypothetical protein
LRSDPPIRNHAAQDLSAVDGGNQTIHRFRRPKRPQGHWSFGTSLGEGDVDIVGEIYATPKNVFSEKEAPNLASFVFRRHVAESEDAVPKDFAKPQCVTAPAMP